MFKEENEDYKMKFKYLILLLKLKFSRKKILEIDLINNTYKINGKPMKKKMLDKFDYVWAEFDPDENSIFKY